MIARVEEEEEEEEMVQRRGSPISHVPIGQDYQQEEKTNQYWSMIGPVLLTKRSSTGRIE